MLAIAARVDSSGASPVLIAVVIVPVPRALVRMSTSPTCEPALVQADFFGTKPETEKPSFKVSSSIVCPPASDAPDSSIFRQAPLISSPIISSGRDAQWEKLKS